MSHSIKVISNTYATLCQELGDLMVKKIQIDKAIDELHLKIRALNEFSAIAIKVENDLNSELKTNKHT
jgi:hypothetical protein